MTILHKLKPFWKACDLSQSLTRMPCVTKDHFFCITSGTVVLNPALLVEATGEILAQGQAT